MMLAENAAFVQALLAKHAGVSLSAEHAHLLHSRLGSLARAHNLRNADALVSCLRSAPVGPLLDCVIEALTTHETSFFRDVAPFRALREQVLPELVRERTTSRRLSIWSAGCSTGQEAYSVALLLRERFPEVATWHLLLWATDVSRAVIERAREGVYSNAEAKRGMTPSALQKYFRATPSGYIVDESVRRMVTWDVMNLCGDWPPMGMFDVILMRNVLIYFSEADRARILARAAAHLAPDGCLLLGASETTFGVSSAFSPSVHEGVTLYRKRIE